MPHDSALYDTVTGHNSPAQTKAAVLAGDGAARDKYQRDARNAARQYAGFVGRPDPYVPVLSSISPSTKAAGSGDFGLTCNGSNFNEDSKIFFGAAELVTVVQSSTVCYCDTVPGTLITAAGTVQVTVKTDGSVSNAKPFTIT